MTGFFMKIDEEKEKKKKEYLAKLAAQKKWFDSLETDGKYNKPLISPLSSEEDFFKDYFEQYNGRLIP